MIMDKEELWDFSDDEKDYLSKGRCVDPYGASMCSESGSKQCLSCYSFELYDEYKPRTGGYSTGQEVINKLLILVLLSGLALLIITNWEWVLEFLAKVFLFLVFSGIVLFTLSKPWYALFAGVAIYALSYLW